MSRRNKLERHRIQEPERNKGSDILLEFFLGFILLCAGIFLVFQSTTVTMAWHSWSIGGFGFPQGAVSIPLLVGVGLVFYNSKSVVSWLVFILGIVCILVTIIMSVRIWFNSTSLFNYILMFGSILAGTGLLLKSLFVKK